MIGSKGLRQTKKGDHEEGRDNNKNRLKKGKKETHWRAQGKARKEIMTRLGTHSGLEIIRWKRS